MPERQRQPGAWLARRLDAQTRQRCFEPAYYEALEEHLETQARRGQFARAVAAVAFRLRVWLLALECLRLHHSRKALAGWLLYRRLPARLASQSASFAQAEHKSHRKGDGIMSLLWQDVRYGARGLLRSPGFTLVAVLTLALGIGANTAVFSVVYGVVLRPLPYDQPERLVVVYQSSRETPVMSVSFPNFLDWRAQAQSFEEMGAATRWSMTLTGAGDAERISSARVTAGLFGALRTQPILGRPFGQEEDRAGAAAVVVLSEPFWERRFARDAQILGKSLTLSGEPHTVIGVMPAGFYSPTVDVFVSLGQWEAGLQRAQYPGISVMARLKRGITVQQARAEMERVAAGLAAQYESNRGQSAVVFPLQEITVKNVRVALWTLLGAVGFVLLIACANVANLLLARATGRQREIAIRHALGAGQWRLVRQLMTEGVLLSVAAGAAGMLLSFWATDLIVAMEPRLPRLSEVRVDGWVLGFAIGLTWLTNLFFGLAPAWLASRVDLAHAMREGARGTSRHHSNVRHGLLIAEVGFAVVLVVGAGLTLQSFSRVMRADTGLRSQNVLTALISLTSERYATNEGRRQFFRDAIERLKGIPGVESAGVVQPMPLGADTWFRSYVVEGEPFPEVGLSQTADNFYVSPEYFRAVGIPLLSGRYFTDHDLAGAPEVCIVDKEFANKHWPNGEAVGKRLAWGFNWKPSDPPKDWATIVGVVGHVKQSGADQESRLQIYNPMEQNTLGMGGFVIKTKGDPAAAAQQVRRAIGELDPNLALYQVQPMPELAAQLSSDRRVITLLLNVFAGLALVLAAVGIYGVMSYTVAQRSQEIGIRVALGAQRTDVYGLVLGTGAKLVFVGIAIGIGAALALARMLQGMLFEITSYDPFIYAIVTVLLSGVALVACLIPAWRATRVDPLVALRSD